MISYAFSIELGNDQHDHKQIFQSVLKSARVKYSIVTSCSKRVLKQFYYTSCTLS